MQLAEFPRRRFIHSPTPLEPLRPAARPISAARRSLDQARRLHRPGAGRQQGAQAGVPGRAGVVTRGRHASHGGRGAVEPLPANGGGGGASHGLTCELVLSRSVASQPSTNTTAHGNLLLDRMFGAGLQFRARGTSTGRPSCEQVAEMVRRRAAGKPFVIPIGGSTPTGALGYVGCAAGDPAAGRGAWAPSSTAVVHCSGSGGTQAGLLVGLARQRHSGDRHQLRRAPRRRSTALRPRSRQPHLARKLGHRARDFATSRSRSSTTMSAPAMACRRRA